MSEHTVVLDEPLIDEQSEDLRRALDRADRAEAELAKLKGAHSTAAHTTTQGGEAHARQDPEATGLDALRADSMMAHLLDSLAAGKDIGHYGRLTFTMVARHFLSDDELVAQLTQDPDCNAEQAALMLEQVKVHDYNPPRRERILEWQADQEFPILPNPHDPDCGNIYRSLKFSSHTYEHIEHYQAEKQEAAAE